MKKITRNIKKREENQYEKKKQVDEDKDEVILYPFTVHFFPHNFPLEKKRTLNVR